MKSIIRKCYEQCTPTNLGNLDETENSMSVIQQAAGLCALPTSGHKRAREHALSDPPGAHACSGRGWGVWSTRRKKLRTRFPASSAEAFVF